MKAEKGWTEIYIVVDLHGTIIPSGRSTNDNQDNMVMYDGAEEVLKWFSNRKDIFLILWTATPKERSPMVLDWFKQRGINFDWLNENPHALNTPRSDFSKKFYFNILLDDRAGFEPETDWYAIKNELIRLDEWNKV